MKVRKLLSLALAGALAVSMSVVGFATTTTLTDNSNANVNVNVRLVSQDVIDATVGWGDMEFTFTDGDDVTDRGKWEIAQNANKVELTNNSLRKSIQGTYDYAKTYDYLEYGIAMFTNEIHEFAPGDSKTGSESLVGDSKVTTGEAAPGTTVTRFVMFTDAPALDDTLYDQGSIQVGTLTVTVAAVD